MSIIDVAAEIRATALGVITKQALGLDWTFDCTLYVTAGSPKPVVSYVLVTTTPSPLLGHMPLMNISQITSPHPTAEQVEQAVTGAMRELRELRAKKLAGQN